MISKLSKIPLFKRLIPSFSIRILKFFKKNRGYFKIKNFYMFLDFLDPIDREIILSQEYEKLEINFLLKQLNFLNANFFLDIGSNCGYYSMKIAIEFPEIKIFAFDPNKEACFKFSKTLEKNFKITQKIKLYNFGLSNLNTKLNIRSLKKHGYAQTGGSSIEREYSKGTYAESLEDFKIGSQIINITNSAVGIKIDVEGHELKVLEGIKKIIKFNRCIIQIEIFKKDFPKINKFLNLNNYKLIYKVEKRSNYFYKNF